MRREDARIWFDQADDESATLVLVLRHTGLNDFGLIVCCGQKPLHLKLSNSLLTKIGITNHNLCVCLN
jgi:hypothetical protein